MTLLKELKEYIGFDEEDAAALRELRPHIEPHLEEITDHFYARILQHSRAHRAITGGEAQVERLKKTLQAWLDSGLAGPHDEAWFERRARIGRVHVRIDLPQRYMFTAMNVMRRDVRRLAEQAYADDREKSRLTGEALDRLFDMELAIMLHTYREDSEARVLRRERLATVGQLAASIAHELRNPLSVIESSVYLLRRRIADDPRAKRHLDKITAQVETSGGIITDLLEMTRDRPPARKPVPVKTLFDETEQSVHISSNVTLTRECPEGLEVQVEPRLVVRALVNLVQNANGALDGRGGAVTMQAEREPDGGVSISVLDDGPGFSPEMLARALEPLVTESRGGVGLGLALVHRICERHGATVEVANRPEGGARVSMTWPGAEYEEAT